MLKALKYQIHTFRKYESLTKELVTRDIKLKYRRSFLGYVWSVLNPLLVMIVLAVVFSAMFKRDVENYPVYLLIGRTTYDFLTISTNQAMTSVTGNAALLKKTYIPKYIFTLTKVTSSMIDFVFSLGALLIVMLVTRTPFHLTILLTPLVFIQLYLFCLGLGFLLATLHVFFRDIRYIYRAVTTMWLYLTPIIYPIERLPHSLQLLIKAFNPLYYYVAQFRDLALYGSLPGPRIFWGGWVFGILMLVIGLCVFRKWKDRFILYI